MQIKQAYAGAERVVEEGAANLLDGWCRLASEAGTRRRRPSGKDDHGR